MLSIPARLPTLGNERQPLLCFSEDFKVVLIRNFLHNKNFPSVSDQWVATAFIILLCKFHGDTHLYEHWLIPYFSLTFTDFSLKKKSMFLEKLD